jgi:hypothetical protein
MVFDSGQGISATVAPESSFLSSRLKKARYKNGDLWQAYHAFFRHFQLAAVLQIRRDTGRAESMITDARLDAGHFRPPADDAVGVLLEEGIGGKLAGLATGGAEEIAVDVIGDAGRFDVIVQTLIETVMTGNVVLLGAFFVHPDPTTAPLDKIVVDLHLNDGADPGEAEDHDPNEGQEAVKGLNLRKLGIK